MKNYAHRGLAGIGGLGKAAQNEIAENALAVQAILQKAGKEKKYRTGDKLPFAEIDRLYNVGISDDEKRAWVWYKRSLGVPMTGWEKYFVSKEKSVSSEIIITKTATEILDNAFRKIAEVPAGIRLGRPTRFKNEYRGVMWLIYVAEDGAKRWVNENHVKFVKSGVSASESVITSFVKKGALYYMAGQHLPYPVYAYGNMYDRELQLRQDEPYIRAEYGDAFFEAHWEVVQKAKPRVISVQNPDPRERPKISVISKFARNSDEFKINQLREDAGVDLQGFAKEEMDNSRYRRGKAGENARAEWEARYDEEASQYTYSLTDAFKLWLRKQDKSEFREVDAEQIIAYYIEATPLPSKERMSEEERDTIQMYTPIEGEELFSKFLNEALAFEDQQKLDILWNRIYNGFSNIPYHRVPIGFECSALFKKSILSFTPAQREAVAFMEIAGSGIIAYDVGVGKTMSAIITLANAIQQGKCQRPVIVVPNPTYAKWIREIVGYKDERTGEMVSGVLTGTGITINEFYNLGVKVKGFDFDKPVKAGSITVMTYEGFAKIGFGQKAMKDLFVELSKIMAQDDEDSKSKRDLQKIYQGYRELIGGGNKGTIADIDTLGFDYLIIDEAHNFKNVFKGVPVDEDGNKRYQITAGESPQAIRAFFHCNYIQRTYGQNVMLLTATPFTNSPLEIYSMLSLVAYDSMRDMGILNLQRFMSTFVLQSLEYVNDYDGQIKLKNVVKSYQNRLVLQKLIYNHIAYKTGEEAGVKRPVKINLPRMKVMKAGKLVTLPKDEQTLTYLKPSAAQARYQEGIVMAAQAAKSLGDIGRAMNKSLDNALSPFLVTGDNTVSPEEFVEGSPKIHYACECIATVKEWHEQRGQTCSGQVIYMNRGKEFFGHIKRYLQKFVGFKSKVKYNGRTFDEVEVVSSGIDPEVKEAIKDAFLDGIVKVIIGTATIREGIDLQKRGTVIYNLYPDWNPTDIRQLEGRIWRQGNDFGYVRVVMPLVQDSMDVFVFQKLEEKTSRINDIWYRSDRGNVLDQEALDPEEIKYHLFTDVEQLVKIRLNSIVKDIDRRYTVLESNLITMNRFKGILSEYRSYGDQVIQGLTKHVNLVKNYIKAKNPDNVYEALNTLNYLKTNFPDEKKRKEYVEKVMATISEVEEFLISAERDDKKLIRLTNIVKDQATKIDGPNAKPISDYAFNQYKSALSQMRKAERTILAQKGYTINDDVSTIIDSIKMDIAKNRQEKDDAVSAENQVKLRQEIREFKEKSAVRGESAEKRAEDFAKLNYLLAYGASEVDADADLPRNRGFMLTAGTQSQSSASQNDREKELLKLKIRLKAQALKLKLKLKQAA